MTRALHRSASIPATLLSAALVTLSTGFGSADDQPNVIVECMRGSADCRERIIRLPDGQPGQVLKFEYCHEGDCDRAHRDHWITHYLVPPPGEVCHNTDINEALHWLEQNRKGWLLAGWGCVSKQQVPA